MAQRVMLVDDLDGSEGAETITYSFDGQEYEIDLSKENADKLRSMMQPYIDASRTVERPAVLTPVAPRSRRSSGSGRQDLHEIREWAMGQNMDVSRRGRIKKEIIDAYDEAHS
jgi:Lsr2